MTGHRTAAVSTSLNLPVDPRYPVDPRNEQPSFSLTQAEVFEFRDLVGRECGVMLDDTEAWNRATELVALFRMLLGPIPEDPAFEQGSNVVAVATSASGKLH